MRALSSSRWVIISSMSALLRIAFRLEISRAPARASPFSSSWRVSSCWVRSASERPNSAASAARRRTEARK